MDVSYDEHVHKLHILTNEAVAQVHSISQRLIINLCSAIFQVVGLLVQNKSIDKYKDVLYNCYWNALRCTVKFDGLHEEESKLIDLLEDINHIPEHLSDLPTSVSMSDSSAFCSYAILKSYLFRNERGPQRKSTLGHFVSNVKLLRFMIGMSYQEFTTLFMGVSPAMRIEFPRTPINEYSTTTTTTHHHAFNNTTNTRPHRARHGFKKSHKIDISKTAYPQLKHNIKKNHGQLINDTINSLDIPANTFSPIESKFLFMVLKHVFNGNWLCDVSLDVINMDKEGKGEHK
eukprot:Awhi_evm2s14900